MATHKQELYVYAHWLGMPEPKMIGVFSAQTVMGKNAFSFEFDQAWIRISPMIMGICG